AINLLKGNSKFIAYKKAIDTILNYYSDNKYSHAISKYSRVLNGNIQEVAENKIESTGYVVHTLEASLWCLLNENNYEDTVLKAVNLGDDTDTTGAVVGGLAGMYYGYDSIPKAWVNEIANITVIEQLIEKFSFAIESNTKLL
ncbi:MAG: ADP-ribosylglycohydrolase family protein, partial [Clostridium sp.]